MQVFQLLNMTGHGNTLRGEILAAERPGEHQRRRQTCAEMSAASEVLKAVIAHMTGIVRVTGPGQVNLLPVILRPGILTADEAGKGLTRRFAPEIAADDLRRVALLARRGKGALTRGTACHLMQHVLHIDLHARGEAVQRHAHGGAVRLSEQGQAKVISEAAAHAI